MRREDAVPVEADVPLPAQRVAPDDAGILARDRSDRGSSDGRGPSAADTNDNGRAGGRGAADSHNGRSAADSHNGRSAADSREAGGSRGAGREGGSPKRERRRRTSLVDKLLIGTGLGLALLVVVGAVGAHVVTNQVLGDVQRIPDVFGSINPSTRPVKPAGAEKTLNFLLMGIDTGTDAQTTGSGGTVAAPSGQERSDVVMLVHVAADRRSASFVSIPRDTWVPVPGNGMNRINTAYALGGGTLLVQTVEQLTKLRVDHFAVLDFAGFKGITDAFGGVDIRLQADSGAAKGSQSHLDGDGALAYLRMTNSRSGSELTQIRHQQAVIRALMSKANSRGLLSSPAGTLHIANSVTEAVSVDDSLGNGDLRSLLLSLRNLKAGAISFVTAPVGSTSRVGKQSVVRLDAGSAAQLWKAVDTDAVPAYLQSQQAS